MWNNGITVGCYIGRNADLGMISEWKAQLLKNQNMLSAAHLSSSKCPDFGIHYNGNCSDKITLSKMSSTRHLRHACRLAQFHDHWEAEIKAFMWEKIRAEIDINISSRALCWIVVRASFWQDISTNMFKVMLFFTKTSLLVDLFAWWMKIETVCIKNSFEKGNTFNKKK